MKMMVALNANENNDGSERLSMVALNAYADDDDSKRLWKWWL